LDNNESILGSPFKFNPEREKYFDLDSDFTTDEQFIRALKSLKKVVVA